MLKGVQSDSSVIINQMINMYPVKDDKMLKYKELAIRLVASFGEVKI